MRPGLRLLPVLVLALGALPAAPAAAGWSAPQTIADVGSNLPTFAGSSLGANGAMAAAYRQYSSTGPTYFGVARTGLGAFDAPVPLSVPGLNPGSSYAFTRNGHGDATLAWVETANRGIRVVSWSPEHGFGRRQALTAPTRSTVAVALNGRGDAVLVRTDHQRSRVLAARRRGVSGKFGRWTTLATSAATPRYNDPRPAQIAVDGHGGVVVLASRLVVTRKATRTRPERHRAQLVGAAASPRGRWLSRALASGPIGTGYSSASPFGAQVAANARGDVLAVWRSAGRLRAAAKGPADRRLRPARTLSSGTQRAANPGLALNAKGAALVSWQATADDSVMVKVSARRPGGKLGRARTFSDPDVVNTDPLPVIGADGSGAVIWHHVASADNAYLEVASRHGYGRFTEPAKLSAGDANGRSPQAYADPEGRIVAVWQGGATYPYAVEAAEWAAGSPPPVGRVLGTAQGEPLFAHVATGDAVIAWEQPSSDPTPGPIVAAVRPPGGEIGAGTTLSAAGSSSRTLLDVDVAPGGRAVVVYAELDGSFGEGHVVGRAADYAP